MFKRLQAKSFAAVPYLETSTLMQSHPKGLTFSTKKPNVIVGPNGAGKSALLKTLSLASLSWLMGYSTFDRNYLSDFEFKGLWGKADDRWYSRPDIFMPGLTLDTDNGPALFYRPGALPGDEPDLAHALCRGYGDEARRVGDLIDKKSSGQAGQAMLGDILAHLAGAAPVLTYRKAQWHGSLEPQNIRDKQFAGDSDYQAEALKARFGQVPADALPVMLMDEPEQSLDARAELQFWKAVLAADCTRQQIIIASHSLYPLLHPKKFNLIEAEPGYIAAVLELAGVVA